MKTLPIIQSLWIDAPFSNLERLCAQSFLDHGHEFHLYAYADIEGVPEGVVIKDGNEILKASELFDGTWQRPSNLADYFRYTLLHQRGGWWVDMDLVCLKPFQFQESIVFAPRGHTATAFNNFILCFPAGNALMSEMQKLCESRLAQKRNHRKRFSHGALGGPTDFTKMVYKLDMQKHVVSSARFYNPAPQVAFNRTYREGLHFPSNTYAVHLRKAGQDKFSIDMNAQFDKESMYEQLKTRHGIRNIPGATQITSDEFEKRYVEFEAKKEAAKRWRKTREKIWASIAVAMMAALLVSYLSG